jgi:hypothetical protein
MNKYYVVRRGTEFKNIFMDAASARLWVCEGWELSARQFETHEQAQLEIQRWRLTFEKKTPQSSPNRSQPSL